MADFKPHETWEEHVKQQVAWLKAPLTGADVNARTGWSSRAGGTTGLTGYGSLPVLPQLTGKPLTGLVVALLGSVRPSRVVVVPYGGCVTCECCPWRVTIWLNQDDTIREVTQEVEFDGAMGHSVDLVLKAKA